MSRRSYCKREKKVRYRDELDAKMAISFFRNKSTRDRIPTRSYKCQYCKGHHLTSQSKKTEVIDAK